jgi:ATP-dependent RNA helicase DeaD
MTSNEIDLTAQIPSPFASLGLDAPLIAALTTLGYEEPTPIQREAIPPLLEGRDVLGQAATGTGKTAAFALPLLQRIGASTSANPSVRALVLVPTRELAMQVAEAIHRYGKGLGTHVLPVYGGQSIQQQLRALRRGVDVIVATPGRALDHIRRGSLTLSQVQVVVLDEADEMLDMGFADDLEEILDALPTERQTALFSATIPPRIAQIAERHLDKPVRVRIARESVPAGTAPRVRQVAYVVPRQYKVAALGRVLDMESPTSAIVFCRTRTEVDELAETLIGRGYRAEPLHGGLSQEQRDRVMQRFRDGTTELLIATDVAARGLDIGHLSHVVNYDVPSAPDAYVHRIGRTGRAGREGVAITLSEPREHRLIRNIEQLTKQRILVEPLPTLVDLRTRRLELTRAALREALVQGDLDRFRVVVEALSEEFDVVDIATAAVKVAHESSGNAGNEEEIPAAGVPRERDRAVRDRSSHRERPEEGERAGTEEHSRGPRRGRRKNRSDADVTRLYVGLGRRAGVRPADLVGAIANEAGIDARAVGSIEIGERFSIVEVPDEAADEIIGALRSTTIRGRRALVRRDREDW